MLCYQLNYEATIEKGNGFRRKYLGKLVVEFSLSFKFTNFT